MHSRQDILRMSYVLFINFFSLFLMCLCVFLPYRRHHAKRIRKETVPSPGSLPSETNVDRLLRRYLPNSF